MNHDGMNYQRFDEPDKIITDAELDRRDRPASPIYFEEFSAWRDEFNRLKALGSWRTETQRLRLGDLFFILYSTFADPVYEWDRSQDADVVEAAKDAFERYQKWARAEEQKDQK